MHLRFAGELFIFIYKCCAAMLCCYAASRFIAFTAHAFSLILNKTMNMFGGGGGGFGVGCVCTGGLFMFMYGKHHQLHRICMNRILGENPYENRMTGIQSILFIYIGTYIYIIYTHVYIMVYNTHIMYTLSVYLFQMRGVDISLREAVFF